MCDNFPIGEYSEKCGLDNVVFQWNHDEFGYMRLKSHLPPHMARLVRYHSIHSSSLKYLSSGDQVLHDVFLKPFRRFDKQSKSATVVPDIDEDKYRKMVDRWFPDSIVI